MVAAMGLIYALALDGVLTFLGDHLKNVLEVSLGNTSLLVALSMVGRIVGALVNSRVTDRVGHRIIKLDASGRHISDIGRSGIEAGEFRSRRLQGPRRDDRSLRPTSGRVKKKA